MNNWLDRLSRMKRTRTVDDKWITVQPSGQHVLIDDDGSVKGGLGGKFDGKKIQSIATPAGRSKSSEASPANNSPQSSQSTQGKYKLNLGEKQSSAYRNWTNELSKKPATESDARFNSRVRQLFSEAPNDKEALGLLKKFLNGDKSAVREVFRRYPAQDSIRTRDSGVAVKGMQYFYTTRLGNTRYEMADGSLLCKDVPIARIGAQVYDESELPGIIGDEDGEIVVTRDADEVFRPETLASFEGMAFTLGHPKDMVNPGNWKEHAHGHIQNVRRGTGDQSDLMLGDIHIKTAEGIQKVMDGQDQISMGYDAEYEQQAPGQARQHTIIGNHCASVPNGRAGIRCSIGDSTFMTTKNQGWFSQLKRAIKTKDADSLADLVDNAPSELIEPSLDLARAVNITINPAQPLPQERELGGLTTDEDGGEGGAMSIGELEKKVDALALLVQQLVNPASTATTDSDPDEEDEKKKATTDAAYHQGVVARAELIMPGVKLPEGGKLAAFKRSTMDAAFRTPEGQALLVPLVGATPDFSKMPKATLDAVFVSASEIAKSRNAAPVTTSRAAFYDSSNKNSPAALNKAFAAHWKK